MVTSTQAGQNEPKYGSEYQDQNPRYAANGTPVSRPLLRHFSPRRRVR